MTPFREPPPAARKPSLVLLMLITVSGPLAVHIFGPAMPDAARELGVDAGAMQRTMSAYLVGFALGHLFLGSLADRLGRRPVVLGGLLAYVVTSIAAALATSIELLMVARLLQGIAAASGLTIGRAMVRDTSDSAGAARSLAFLGLVLSGAPVLSPALGGLVAAWFGWRWIFAGMAVFGALLLAACALRLPETRAATAVPPRGLFAGIAILARSRRFIGYGLGGALATGSAYAFLAAAPFIYVDLFDVPQAEVGLYILSLMLGVSLGAVVAGRLAGRWSVPRTATLASGIGAVAALLMLLLDLSGQIGAVNMTLAMMLLVFGNGLLLPNALAGAMEVDARAIGAAAGLLGFLMQATGVLCTMAVSLWYDNSVLPLAVVLLAVTALGFIILRAGTAGTEGGAP